MRGNARAVGALLVGFVCMGAAWAASPASIEKSFTFAILEDYDKGEDLNQVEADFRLFDELGIHTWRGSFGWDDYEPERTRYDFDWLHRFADLAQQHHLLLRPYLGYTPEWAAKRDGQDEAIWNNPPADVSDWRKFVQQIASAMKRHSNVLSFEIYNEENAPLWWDGTPGEYAQVLKSGSDAVRAENSGAPILFGGITYPDQEWMEALCVGNGAGHTFDILPIHAYPETWTPHSITVENYLDHNVPGYFENEFLPVADRECGKKPVWLNEAGFATIPGVTSERDQANWWARAIATWAAEPRVEALGIYEIKDKPRHEAVIGEQENYHLGLTYPDRRKKLAFHTVKLLVSLLGTETFAVIDNEAIVRKSGGTNGEFHYHLFKRPDGKQVLILWDKYAAPRVQVQLVRKGSQVTEYELDGSARPYADFDGRLLRNVQLTGGEVRVFVIAR